VFTEHLRKLVEDVDGGIGSLIMGLDGIAVDSYVRDNASADITTIGMEFSFILTQVRKAGEILEIGGIEELTIKAERLTLIVRMLTDEYFLALMIDADGNFGKGRFFMRVAAPRLIAEL
jgi:predicted regulator of Ras-like GTPase activity (Roadblock/LC7/MglB family)